MRSSLTWVVPSVVEVLTSFSWPVTEPMPATVSVPLSTATSCRSAPSVKLSVTGVPPVAICWVTAWPRVLMRTAAVAVRLTSVPKPCSAAAPEA